MTLPLTTSPFSFLSRLTDIFAGVAILFSGLEKFLTYVAIKYYPNVGEANPVEIFLIEHYGLVSDLVFSFLFSVILILAVAIISEYRKNDKAYNNLRVAGFLVSWAIMSGFLFIFFHNLFLLV